MSSLPSLVRLAILDTYGVEWPLPTFARDVLQNFFDAALSFRDVVLDRDDAARTLEIRGPVEFDLELLAYVGATTKLDGKTAGGFGEGFKICALVGVRDHGLAIRAGSGETELEVVFEPVPLGREVCYRVHRAPGRKGSFVRLEGCSDAVFAAFETARHQFYDADNPHLGPLVAADEAGTVAVHLAAEGEKRGEIYYRRQFRGEIEYGGHRLGPVTRLTFACHRAVDYLEGDRDRRTLEPESVARAVGERLPPEALYAVFLLLQSEWHQWHEIIAGLLRAAMERKLRFEWPDEWVARSSHNRDYALSQAAERKGYKLALPSFSELGMQTAKDVVKLGKVMTHTPIGVERERIDVAVALYSTLADDDPPSTAWQVVDSPKTDPLHSRHENRELSVASRLLGADGFALGTATMLHELAHELGEEGDAAFLHRLSRLVGAAIRDPAAITAARARFEQERPKGRRVRETPDEVAPYTPPHDKYAAGVRGHSFYVNVYVPPGFPPTTALVARLHEGAAAANLACYAAVTDVWSSTEALHHKVTGLPCIKFSSSEAEVDPKGVSRRPGLRLRTYGPERDILPSVEMVADGFRAFLAEVQARGPYVTTPEQMLSYRDMYARKRCSEWIKATAKGTWREQLKIGLTHAVSNRILALKKGIEQTEEALFIAVRDDVMRILQAADAHVAAQTDYDAGDRFEEEALRVAHTVFMAGFAVGGAERAARDFAVIREASKALLAVDLSADMRDSVLAWCVARTGPKDNYLYDHALPALDAAAFRAAFTPALAEAGKVQYILDHDERGLRWAELQRRLESAVQTPEERQKARAARLAQSGALVLWVRHRNMRNAMTHTIKATWERTLAETGSAATAGEACIALLRQLENEVAADKRRADAADAANAANMATVANANKGAA